MNIDEFLGDDPQRKRIFAAVDRALREVGDSQVRVSKSQIAYRRRRTYAAVWKPDQYLRKNTPPLVLSLFLPQRIPSARWKEVVEPSPGRFTHHLELTGPGDVDDEVSMWIRRAYDWSGDQ